MSTWRPSRHIWVLFIKLNKCSRRMPSILLSQNSKKYNAWLEQIGTYEWSHKLAIRKPLSLNEICMSRTMAKTYITENWDWTCNNILRLIYRKNKNVSSKKIRKLIPHQVDCEEREDHTLIKVYSKKNMFLYY